MTAVSRPINLYKSKYIVSLDTKEFLIESCFNVLLLILQLIGSLRNDDGYRNDIARKQ